ncbi:MAG: hypothetical protein JWO03_2748 [Bacteroidetes bacterium]|nr:hypothetical protein [Bacteroidota bacterium]
MRNKIFLFISIALLLSSCAKDTDKATGAGNVIIVNEGGFGHGDASISLYDASAKAVTNDIFKTQNNFSLGDVAQSLYLMGDTAYIVMNNSHSIIVADAAHNFQYLRSISMTGASPRFFIPTGGSKAYVTDLYANKIWIIDYRAGTITGNIPVTGWTEEMVASNGNILVLEKTAPGGADVHKLLKIDPATDQVTGSIDFTTDPGSMALTDQGKLFVLTSQQSSPVVKASLYIIDPAFLTIDHKMDFDPARTPNYLRYSALERKMLFADNGIYSMAQTDTVLPAAASIASNNWNVYGLNADPVTGDIYISDALDYQQASHIMRYSKNGTLIDAFNTGIITNGFIFK